MSEIDFGDGSWEDARGTIQNTLQELVGICKGNGRAGVVEVLNSFITEYRTDRAAEIKFRDQRDKETKDRLDRATRRQTLWLSLAGLIMTVLLVIIAWRELERKISASVPAPVVSSSQQNAVDKSIETGK